jgi:DNA helicase HerA-like ATPase
MSPASVGVLLRSIVVMQQEGADAFFGEPEFDVDDLLRTTPDGKGLISLVELPNLQDRPAIFSTFLMWLLAELFRALPEVGDVDKPKLVFFFDEAHLLFNDASEAFLDQIAQTVRLIRSKGVGVFFVTQQPTDIPDEVLGQLGNRIQHALRAFTPRDQRAVRAAAETFRANPKLDVGTAITELGVGEALVSTLQDKGAPSVVERTLIRPPCSRIGPATAEERQVVMSRSPVAGRYDQAIDRESAYEVLQSRAKQAADAAAAEAEQRREESGQRGGRQRQSPVEAMITSAARSIGTQIGRQLLRGILGSLTRR